MGKHENWHDDYVVQVKSNRQFRLGAINNSKAPRANG